MKKNISWGTGRGRFSHAFFIHMTFSLTFAFQFFPCVLLFSWCMAELIGMTFILGAHGSFLPLRHSRLLLSRVVQSSPLIHSFIHSFLSRQWELCWVLEESSWAGDKAVWGSCNPAVRESRFSGTPGLLLWARLRLPTCECLYCAVHSAQCRFAYWRDTETHFCLFLFIFF